MTESRIAFLYKASSILPCVKNNKTQEKLKSYYRMRCKEISKGYGLPQKQFSEQVICSHCCMDWGRGREITVRSVKLNKRQRKRIKSQSKMKNNTNRIHLLHSKEIEQTCTFCKHSTKIVVPKINKQKINQPQQPVNELKISRKKNEIVNIKDQKTCNVYGKTEQVFSLNNKKNTLKSTIKKPKPIIKNNKKKKDKFAGLCKKAVLTAALLKKKQDSQKQDKLSLFLKPSL